MVVEEQADCEAKDHRYFMVGFKDGTLRSVVPKENDPLEFEEQVVASKALGILLMRPGKKSKQLMRRGSVEYLCTRPLLLNPRQTAKTDRLSAVRPFHLLGRALINAQP